MRHIAIDLRKETFLQRFEAMPSVLNCNDLVKLRLFETTDAVRWAIKLNKIPYFIKNRKPYFHKNEIRNWIKTRNLND